MLKRLMGVFTCCAIFAFVSSVGAQEGEEGGGEKPKKERKQKEKKEKKEKKDRPARAKPEEMTLSGKLDKKENTVKKKDKEQTVVSYVLTTGEGASVVVPKPRAPKKKKKGAEGEAPKAINLEDFVGKNVTVVGMGLKQKKKDKEVIRLISVKSITEAAAAPGE